MHQPDLIKLLNRYQRGECTPDEIRKVEQWYEDLGREQAEYSFAEGEEEALSNSLWQGIEQRIARPAPVVRTIHWRAWAAAAAIVVALGAGAFWLRLGNYLPVAFQRAPASAQSEWIVQHNDGVKTVIIHLQDGTEVQLSPASSLKYPHHFSRHNRDVTLVGEAFFEVAHDTTHPFRVLTDKILTTVVGTSFTVRAFPGQAQAQVMVRTGKVRVTPTVPVGVAGKSSKASVLLLPNQQVVYSPAAPELRKELVTEPVLLSNTPFVFDDRPLAEVVEALEKAYGVDIAYDKQTLANCTLTLNLAESSLYDKLNVLCKALRGTYEVEGTRITLHAKKCR